MTNEEDIIKLLGKPNPFHDIQFPTMEMYWFHRMIEECERMERMIRDGVIADFTIESESEPLLGLFRYTVTPVGIPGIYDYKVVCDENPNQ